MSNLAYSALDGRTLVRGLSCEVRAGEVLAITGPNGSGKSTLLRVLLGEQHATEGEVHWATRSVAYLSQLHNREFHIPLALSDILSFGVSGRLSTEAACAFGLLGVHDLGRAWNTASGGERQKTLLTKTLLSAAQVLVLDEPMNHLDAGARTQLVSILRDYIAASQRCVIMVCHESLLEAQGLDQVSVLDLGQLTVN